MGGFFGGGTKTVTQPAGQPTASPAQEAYTQAITPSALAQAQAQANLSGAGAGQLLAGQPGVASGLAQALQMGSFEQGAPGAAQQALSLAEPGLWKGVNALGDVTNTSGRPAEQAAAYGLQHLADAAATSGDIPNYARGQAGIGSASQQLLNSRQDMPNYDYGMYGGAQRGLGQAAGIAGAMGRTPSYDYGSYGLGQQGGFGTAQALSQMQAPGAAQASQDARSLLQPLTEQFREQVLPDIQSQSLAAGAFGGGRQGDLTTQAAGRFGSDAAAMLEANKAQLMGQNTAAFNAQAAAQQAAGQQYGQGASRAAESLGAQTGLYGAGTQAQLGAGSLYGQQGQLANQAYGSQLGGYNALTNALQAGGGLAGQQSGLANQYMGTQAGALGTAGNLYGQLGQMGISQDQNLIKAGLGQGSLAQMVQQAYMQPNIAGQQQDVLGRGLATQQAQLPWTLANALLSGGAGIPMQNPLFSPLAYPGGSQVTQGTAGAQAGAGVGSILGLLPLFGIGG